MQCEFMPHYLPQLDFSTYTSQFFWLAINFIALYVFIAKVFIPRIESNLHHRNKLTIDKISAARRLDELAMTEKTNYEREIQQTKVQCKLLINKTIQQTIQDRAQALKDLANTIAQKQTLAVQEVDKFKQETKKEVVLFAKNIAVLYNRSVSCNSKTDTEQLILQRVINDYQT